MTIAKISALVAILVAAGGWLVSPYRPVLMVELEPDRCTQLQHDLNWAWESWQHRKEDLEEEPDNAFLAKQLLQIQTQIDEIEAARKELGCRPSG